MAAGLAGLQFVNPHRGGAGLGRHHAAIPATAPAPLATAVRKLEVEFAGAGRMLDLETFRVETWTNALVVVDRETVVHEWYPPGLGPDDLFLGASMTKSVLAGLVGSAVDDGRLRLDDRVVDHVPELADSGYADVTVGQVATMTTGLDWVEDHRDPTSYASRLVDCFTQGVGGSRALLTELPARYVPGTRYSYCTADSQVLDWVRERVTGLDYATALSAWWAELGCTNDAVVGLDGPGGVALAGGSLAASARDWARIGMLQVTGELGGRRLLSPDWVQRSSTPAAPFLRPGRLPSTITTHAGFGLHWWPLDDAGRRVTADGSRGQFTYIDRDNGVVVVLTSQWPYDEATDRQCRDLAYLALPAIAAAAGAAR